MLLKKIDRAAAFLAEWQAAFRCPYCHENVKLTTGHGITCPKGHHFDLSKKGTLFFLKKVVQSEYDEKLFQHRRSLIEAGMYDPVLQEILLLTGNQPASLLDAGCGDGSFLNRLLQLGLTNQGARIGFDIAKKGIEMAAGQSCSAFWCVADMTNLPFADQSMEVVLNFLSPSNYGEFQRVLQPGGKIIKIIPGTNYLQELRQVFFAGQIEKQAYSNQLIEDHFTSKLSVLERKRVSYSFPLTSTCYQSLLKMSPLSWSVDKILLENAIRRPLKNITVDLEILCGEVNTKKS